MTTEQRNNAYCRVLDIDPPRLEDVIGRPEANNFGLLVAALLERGEPMTLAQVARRFEQAGVASFDRALTSLQRSRPATRPIHRDGDHYELDPHDAEAKMWVVRLGLRRRDTPAARPQPSTVSTSKNPLSQLSLADLEQAFEPDAILRSWSAQRLALAVLDAHGEPMPPARVVAYLSARTKLHNLHADSFRPERSNAAVREIAGCWTIVPEHDALYSARVAVRACLTRIRSRAARRSDPVDVAASQAAYEARAAAETTALFEARQAIIVAFPPEDPAVALVVNLEHHHTELFMVRSFDELREHLTAFEIFIGLDIRAILRRLDVEPGDRRLLDLAPPQKTCRLTERGKPVFLTAELLIRSSCGIDRPFVSESTMDGYLARGDVGRLRRALESNASSLRALYEYARLHDAMRVTWRGNEAMLSFGWSLALDSPLRVMTRMADQQDRSLEIVLEPVTDWREPWANSRIAFAQGGLSGWSHAIVDDFGREYANHDILLARLADEIEPATADVHVPEIDVPARPTLADDAVVGEWRITQMERWDADYFDMDGPAHIIIDPGEHPRGYLRFGLVWGEMDCRRTLIDDRPSLEFTWVGEDEGEPMSGRGWLSVVGDEMHGQVFMHLGDDSTLDAVRVSTRRIRTLQ